VCVIQLRFVLLISHLVPGGLALITFCGKQPNYLGAEMCATMSNYRECIRSESPVLKSVEADFGGRTLLLKASLNFTFVQHLTNMRRRVRPNLT